ncbi:hypothetical protein RD792_006425 [Penstemon davidsonii]|uniref:Sugar phosphate transporter domain-containing protein n=1 Tax=Penstemon davidsonii TaxID=160366 RepID=A0ABR0DCX9_9LAMI|nr:hypothetical protein RD792_006425 [Penstemon davidsonii]
MSPKELETEGVDDLASTDNKEVGIKRDPSFSGWFDEDGILHETRLENEEINELDFDFKLPLVQKHGSENRVLDRQRFHLSDSWQKMDRGENIDDATVNGLQNQDESYVPFDIEDNQVVDGRYSNDLNYTDYIGTSKPKAENPIFVADVLKTLFFILVWYTFSTFLTLYNKTLLGDHLGKFPAPLLMNTVHFAMQAALSKAITWYWSDRSHSSVMSWKDYFVRVVPTALSTAMDINLSNASLVFISVTFATMCKSASPIFLLLFAFAFRLESPSVKLLGIMLVISVGVLLTGCVGLGNTFQNLRRRLNLSFGVSYLLCLLLSCLGSVGLCHKCFSRYELRGLKNPLTLMSYVSPVMAIATALLSLIFDPWHEFRTNDYFDSSWHIVRSCLLMLFGGTLAFFMVLTEYILLSVTSAVTVTIAGVVKEAVTILVAVFYFHDEFTWLKGAGLVTIMIGVSLFNWYK